MNILIATDSFKGCLSSIEAATAIEEGIKDILPSATITKLPVSDGGEGMLEAFTYAQDTHFVEFIAHDPLMRPITTTYACTADGKVAFIETARTAGLALLSPQERNPLLTSTFGVGETICHAVQNGARTIIIGLGGSSTTDGGCGLAQALGVRFLDAQGNALFGCGNNLHLIQSIDCTLISDAVRNTNIRIASDVASPFYGTMGAAKVFASQKGASAENIEKLDFGMKHLASLVAKQFAIQLQDLPGSGAAGGLGGGLMAFFHASMKSGIHWLLERPHFRQALDKTDCIITGEGHMDEQTHQGKAAWGILQEGLKRRIPVYAIAGKIDDCAKMEQVGFTAVWQATPNDIPLLKATEPSFARTNIRKSARAIARQLKSHPK